MSPEFNKDEKFQNDALFDLEFESRETKSAQYYQERANSNVIIQQLNKNQEKEFEQKRSELHNSTSAMQNINFNLEWIQKYDPQLAAQADAYLKRIMNTDLSNPKDVKSITQRTVDLDGSKKSLFGRLKNKAKNFLYPNNAKAAIEREIENLQKQIAKDPEAFEDLIRRAKEKNSGERVSFSQVFEQRTDLLAQYNSKRVNAMHEKEDNAAYQQKNLNLEKEHLDNIDKIHEVRDNAAKEIEQRAMARETTGLKDASANTGVDRLEEKAKMMEGMTPQQRLAFRMSQLRGTAKSEAKPVVKRELDSKIMNKTLEGKQNS